MNITYLYNLIDKTNIICVILDKPPCPSLLIRITEYSITKRANGETSYKSSKWTQMILSSI